MLDSLPCADALVVVSCGRGAGGVPITPLLPAGTRFLRREGIAREPGQVRVVKHDGVDEGADAEVGTTQCRLKGRRAQNVALIGVPGRRKRLLVKQTITVTPTTTTLTLPGPGFVTVVGWMPTKKMCPGILPFHEVTTPQNVPASKTVGVLSPRMSGCLNTVFDCAFSHNRNAWCLHPRRTGQKGTWTG